MERLNGGSYAAGGQRMKAASSLDNKSPQNQNAGQLASISYKTKRRRSRQALIVNIGRIVFLVCLLIVWQFISGRYVNPLFISSPLAVWERLYGWIGDGTLWFHTEITLQETLLGLFFGLVSGILVGFVLGLQQTVARALEPFIVSVYSIPKI